MNQDSQAHAPSNIFVRIFAGVFRLFFPIYKKEWKKYLPTSMMMFIILFNYTVVRTLKDTLIVESAGAEVLNYLKLLVVLPSSFMFVVFYSKISNVFSKTNVFYVSVLPFILFNILFAYVFYPNSDYFHPSVETIEYLKATYPKLKAIFPIYGLWTYSLFYTFSELWGVLGISLLFWQFANRITSSSEAKRFYPSFGLVGNIGFTLGAYILSTVNESARKGIADFSSQFGIIMNIVIILSVILVAIYWGINKYVLNDPEMVPCNNKPKKKKVKPSLIESFKVIFSSKYLGCIMLLVFSYNAMINLVEVTWKSQVKAYTNVVGDKAMSRANYTAFIAGTNFYMGIVSIILFATASTLLSKFRWAVSASITPIVMVCTSILFFVLTVFPKFAAPLTSLFATTPLFLAVFIGSIQNIASKSTKYSLFDPTKEMTYIPLDDELKSKGKAAVDVAGSRISKSFGSAVQTALFFILGVSTQLEIAPYLMIFIIVIGLIWFTAISKLSTQYTEILKKDECTTD